MVPALASFITAYQKLGGLVALTTTVPWQEAYLADNINELYRNEAALHRDDLGGGAFAWIACDDRAHSVLCYERRDGADNVLVVVANFTPMPRRAYRVGMPRGAPPRRGGDRAGRGRAAACRRGLRRYGRGR